MTRTVKKSVSPLQESFTFLLETNDEWKVRPPFDPKQLFRLAAEGIFLGTSSWKYRGWEGVIYKGHYANEAHFQRVALREYTSYFPSVGVDFTYFLWPQKDMMSFLVESTPDNFRLCPKVTKRITMDRFPNLPIHGKWAGQKNPDYLRVDLFLEQFYPAIKILAPRMGVLLFEFSGPEKEDFPAIEAFFSKIPRDFPMAIEVRNPEIVTEDFYRLLRDLKLVPAFSSWTRMPSIREQWAIYRKSGGENDSGPIVGLGFLKPGRHYDEAVRLFQPYDGIKDPVPAVRNDLVNLAAFGRQSNRKTFILINNRLEGSAPFTIGSLAELLQSAH